MATKKVHYFLKDSLSKIMNRTMWTKALFWANCSCALRRTALAPQQLENVNYVSCSCIWWVLRLLIMRRRGCWGLRCNTCSSSSSTSSTRPLLLLLLRCNACNSSTRPCQAAIRFNGTVPDLICGTVPCTCSTLAQYHRSDQRLYTIRYQVLVTRYYSKVKWALDSKIVMHRCCVW